MSRVNLLDLLPSELEDLAESLGAPRYRGRQITSWLYGKGATDIEAMSDLPRDFRAALSERATVAVPQIERRTPSQDGSQKLVLILEERRSISGRGMEYHGESSEFILRNDVRARFEPERKP